MKQAKQRGDAPEAGDRDFAFRFIGVIVALLALIGVFALIGRHVQRIATREHTTELQGSAMSRRLAPPGRVATDPLQLVAAPPPAAAPASSGPKGGDQIVQQVCSACHQAGVMGAPRIGDAPAWKARLKADGGRDGLVKSASQGKGSMPPRGGRPDLSDADLRAAIDAMLKQSGA